MAECKAGPSWAASITSTSGPRDILPPHDGKPVHRTRLGKPLTKGSVEEVLRNRTYTGVTVSAPGTPDEEVRPGKHDAIITDDEWEQIVATRRSRTTRTGRRPRSRCYPLSRPARCYHCGASFKGDTGGKRGHRRLRHAVAVPCVTTKRSHPADLIEAQFGRLLSARFGLPHEWERVALSAFASDDGAGTDDPAEEAQRQRLRAALENLRKQHTWGDVDDESYLRERTSLQRRLDALRPAPTTPTLLPDVRRAGELLADLGELWAHPGVAPEQRQALVEEVFEDVQLDEEGIRAVTPRESYRQVIAVCEGVGGYGRGDWI